MAVAHSAASESHTGTTGSTNQAAFSWTHTQTGTPQGVVVFVSTYLTVTDTVTSVTYGGVALTRLAGGLAQDGAGELGRLDTFFLGSGLGTGNQTITVNRTNNATQMYAAAATVTAGANTAVPTATIVLLEGDGTLAVQSVDDTSPGQNSVRYAGCYSGLNTPPTAGTGSTLLNSIDIGNYGAALVRETTAGQGARNVGFTGATDDRAAVHLAIRELVPRTETPIVGAFTLTGNDATFTKASPKVIEPVVGAFALTGNPADLRHNPDLEAGTGAFTLDGQPVDAHHNVRIEANTGTFTLTGGQPTLQRGRNVIAETGSFALSGNPATFRHAWALDANTGTFNLTGNPASLTELGAYEIDPILGTFSLTGQPAQLTQNKSLSVDAGQFTLTGNPATLEHDQRVTAETGAFTLTGNAATFAVSRTVTGETGIFTLTGNAATLAKQTGKQLTADLGTFVLAGQQVNLQIGRILPADTGAFTFTGNSATFTEAGDFQILADTGAFILTGLSATLAKSTTGRRRNVLIF